MDWTEFNKRFPTEESCRNYLFKKKWTDGFFCPKCECKKYWLLDPYKYKCQQCGYQSTITTGTVFEHTHLSMRQWFAAIEYVGSCGNSATASGLNTELKNIDLEIGSNRTRLNIMKMLKMMGVFAELERNMISQRVKSGMENAKAKGKTIGRPVTTIDNIPSVFYHYYPQYKNKQINKSELARLCSLSIPTVYKYLKIIEEQY